MPNKRWNNEAKEYIFNKFSEFKQSKGKQGINPEIREKSEILSEVYEKDPFFLQYSRSTFAGHYLDIANKFGINNIKKGARKQGE